MKNPREDRQNEKLKNNQELRDTIVKLTMILSEGAEKAGSQIAKERIEGMRKQMVGFSEHTSEIPEDPNDPND